MSLINPNAKEMLEMRVSGATFQEIANKYGVSRQAVHQTLNSYMARLQGKRYALDVDKIIYKGIAEWFLENPNESITSFSKRVLGCDSGQRSGAIKRGLIGENETYFTINQIKKICEVVGKPFEEVFELRGEEE